jgi:hypothetical protein
MDINIYDIICENCEKIVGMATGMLVDTNEEIYCLKCAERLKQKNGEKQND